MTEPHAQYLAALFQSVSHVIAAECILKEAQVPHKRRRGAFAVCPRCEEGYPAADGLICRVSRVN